MGLRSGAADRAGGGGELTEQRVWDWRLLVLGVVTGIQAGLLGIGGGVVMVPVLVTLGFSRHVSNAISLATILLVALAGLAGFAVSGAVDFPVGLVMGAGGVIGATIGARWANRLSGVTLARIFGVLLIGVGLRMLWGGEASGSVAMSLPWSLLVAVAIGVAVGVLSGLTGVGGGVVMVPAMVFLLGLGQHVAEGTSLLAILFTAAAGTRVNLGNRLVQWRPVFLLALTGVVAAPVAALYAQRIPADTLTRIFAVWLLLVAVRTLWKSWGTGAG
jgi:uncharacterized membrane protein YfcA